MLLKVKLSEIPADMLRSGDCFVLTTDKPTEFYTVLDKHDEGWSQREFWINVISIPSSKHDCLYISPSATVYIISPHVRG